MSRADTTALSFSSPTRLPKRTSTRRSRREHREEEKEMAFCKKANQAYLIFKENGSLLSKLDETELYDIVCFLCSVEKTKGDTYSKHSGSMKKTKERIAMV